MLPLLLLLAAAPAPSEPPEKWLLGWVDEVATPRFMADFHKQYPGSPHRADTERFEMTARCYAASRQPTPALTPLLEALRTRLQSGRERCVTPAKAACGLPERPLPQRARAAAALGCLRDPAAIDGLAVLASGPDEELAREAIDALGFFGSRQRVAGFLVFGGTPHQVVFPPAPDPRATRALIAAWDAQPKLRYRVLYALSTHEAVELDRLVQAALTPGAEPLLLSPALGLIREQRCVRCLPWVTPLLASPEAWARREAIEVLGQVPAGASVSPLVAALADGDDNVREEAQRALVALSGIEAPFQSTRVPLGDAALLQAGWRKRWGERGERFDSSAALAPRERPPGLY